MPKPTRIVIGGVDTHGRTHHALTAGSIRRLGLSGCRGPRASRWLPSRAGPDLEQLRPRGQGTIATHHHNSTTRPTTTASTRTACKTPARALPSSSGLLGHCSSMRRRPWPGSQPAARHAVWIPCLLSFKQTNHTNRDNRQQPADTRQPRGSWGRCGGRPCARPRSWRRPSASSYPQPGAGGPPDAAVQMQGERVGSGVESATTTAEGDDGSG
jgi:hypothetical protein